MSDQIKVVFMGTPDFAVPSLQSLEHDEIDVVGVVTVADKPAGRGRKLKPSAVKKYALEKGYIVLQPQNLKDPDFLDQLKSFKADLFVVVAFRMLPREVWNMPSKGTINLHASLLPDYRGAAPINRAIINGEEKTGATTFFINQNIDTGSIIDQVEVPISNEDTAGTLHDKLMVKGAQLLQKTVLRIHRNQVKPISQDQIAAGKNLNEAPKIFKNDCKINWHQPTSKVVNLIRGLNPFPGAFTFIELEGQKKQLKIFDVCSAGVELNPGVVLLQEDIYIGTQDGSLKVITLQMEGKKRMKAADFLRGVKNTLSEKYTQCS